MENLFRQCIQAVHRSMDLDDIFKALSDSLGTYFQADRCFVSRIKGGRLSPPTSEYRSSNDIKSILHIPNDYWDSLSEISARLCSQNSLVEYQEENEDQRWCSDQRLSGLQDIYFKSGLAAPAFHETDCLAVIFIHLVHNARRWTDEDRHVVETVAAEVAVATHRAVLLQEVTEAYRELEASNRIIQSQKEQLERFSGIAAHDLKSPANKINRFAELLVKTENPERHKEYQERIKKAVMHFNALLDDLRALSNATQELPVEWVGVRSILDKVLEEMALEIENHGTTVQVGDICSGKAPAMPVHQILRNLLDNAIKYNNKPDPQVFIQCRQNDGTLAFQIRDNGIGISGEDQKHIFEGFQRIHPADYPGTGLGLYICRLIVEKLNGQIRVESQPGEGSTFTVEIPAKT